MSSLVFFSFNSPRKMSANGTGKRQGPRPRTSSLLCPPPSSSRRTWKVSNCLIPGVFWDGRSWHEWKLGAVLHLELFWGPWWIKWNSSLGKWTDWGGKMMKTSQFITCQWPMASSKPLFIVKWRSESLCQAFSLQTGRRLRVSQLSDQKCHWLQLRALSLTQMSPNAHSLTQGGWRVDSNICQAPNSVQSLIRSRLCSAIPHLEECPASPLIRSLTCRDPPFRFI